MYSITEKTDGKKFSSALRKLAVSDNEALVSQIIEREKALSILEQGIDGREATMDRVVERLYKVTAAEETLMARE